MGANEPDCGLREREILMQIVREEGMFVARKSDAGTDGMP